MNQKNVSSLWKFYQTHSNNLHFRITRLEFNNRSYQSIQRRSVLGVHWKNWCWSWNSNTLATWCKELTRWKRPWCWKGLGAGEEGDQRGWYGWMASPTHWTWVWVNSRSLWWTGRPGVLWFMGLQKVGHDLATELNWTDILMAILLIVF